MQKLYTTTSKDDYAILLDILEIQGIYEEHAITLDENSENLYTVFVNEEDFDKAGEILKEQDFEENYKGYDEKVLVDELIYQDNSLEKEEKIKSALREKGISEEEVLKRKEQEVEKEFEPLHITQNQLLIGYLGLVCLGVVGLPIGIRVLFSKSTHPITKERFYTFDKESRNHARVIVIAGSIITGGFLYVLNY